MTGKKTYLFLFLSLLPLIAGLAVWQAGALIKEQRKEREIWIVTAENQEGEILQEVLFTMGEFPGLEKIWTVIQADMEIKVGNYRTSAAVQGVDLASYPLETVKSAGQKAQGNTPLLAAGEDFFKQLEDENGIPISERQAQVLLQEVGDLETELKLSGEESSEEQEEGEADTGGFLGVVKGNGVYMGQEEIKRWLTGKGLHPLVTKVCMEIRGKERTDSAVKSLETAGFLAEAKQKEERKQG